MVSNGWHTGIVVERAAIVASGLVPEASDFPGARLLEFGWGDRAYYAARDATVWTALRAALAPTPSVLHVAPLDRPPSSSAGREVVRLSLSEAALERLARAVSASFDRPAAGAAKPIARGLRPGARFYPARGGFHLFNTCNTWTARVLSRAGVGVSAKGVVTAGTVIERVREAAYRRERPDAP